MRVSNAQYCMWNMCVESHTIGMQLIVRYLSFEESREKMGGIDVQDVWKSDMRSNFKNDQATSGNLLIYVIILYYSEWEEE